MYKYIEIIRDEDSLVIKRINVSAKHKQTVTKIFNQTLNKTNTKLFSVKINSYINKMPIMDNPYNDENNGQ